MLNCCKSCPFEHNLIKHELKHFLAKSKFWNVYCKLRAIYSSLTILRLATDSMNLYWYQQFPFLTLQWYCCPVSIEVHRASYYLLYRLPWSCWRHQMEKFSASLAICAGNSPVPGEFPAQRPVTQSFDVFFDLRLNKRLSKQSWGWWFETLSRPLWRHRNGVQILDFCINVSPVGKDYRHISCI